MNRLRCATAWAVFALLPLAVEAQTVYRCGPDGRSYSQEPCPQGRPVDVSDARTREQQAQTAAAATRDARTASALEKNRRRSEALPGTGPASLSAPRPPAPAASKPAHQGKPKPKGKPGKAATEDFRAVEPVTPKPAGSR